MFYSRCPSDRLIRINIHVLSVRSLRGVGHAIALHPSQFRLHHMHNGPPSNHPPLHVHRSSVPREGKVQGNLRRPGFDIRRTHRILSTILPRTRSRRSRVSQKFAHSETTIQIQHTRTNTHAHTHANTFQPSTTHARLSLSIFQKTDIPAQCTHHSRCVLFLFVSCPQKSVYQFFFYR